MTLWRASRNCALVARSGPSGRAFVCRSVSAIGRFTAYRHRRGQDMRLHWFMKLFAAGLLLVQVGAEWMPRFAGLGDISLYTTLSYNTGDDTSVLFGLWRYFGQNGKSLIRRHREDDPQVTILWIVGQAVGDLDNIIQTIREFRGG